jgi:hypothetical protein
MFRESASRLLRVVAASLSDTRPILLSIGIALGLFLNSAAKIASTSFPSNPVLETLANYSVWFYLLFGLGITFIPYIPLFFRDTRSTDKTLREIEILKKMIESSNLTENQKLEMWRSIISKYLETSGVGKSPAEIDARPGSAQEGRAE